MNLLGGDPKKVRRILFHEITKNAVRKAIDQPGEIDMNKVNAQQARRVLDRLVGYKLSPLLWDKVRRGLSAGRVQSVAVRMIVEREREIKAFVPEEYWTFTANLEKPGQAPAFDAKLSLWKGRRSESTQTYDLFSEPYRVKATTLRSAEDVDAVTKVLQSGVFKIVKVEKKEVRRRPPPPFSTSTLQQAASHKMGFAAERTMRVAQSLYEGVAMEGKEPAGLITYMRTDSFAIAKSAAAECADYVGATYGASYRPAEPPTYQTKSRGAQEAHEAIRPTSVLRTPDEIKKFLNPDQLKLYELIWKRFVASQMVEAVYDTASADVANGDAIFHCTGRTLKYDGFLRVYRDAPKNPDELPGRGARGRGRKPPAAARRGRRPHAQPDAPRGAPHEPAAVLQRGEPDPRHGKARHRPAVDVRADDQDHRGPRLRAPQHEGPQAHPVGAGHPRHRRSSRSTSPRSSASPTRPTWKASSTASRRARRPGPTWSRSSTTLS